MSLRSDPQAAASGPGLRFWLPAGVLAASLLAATSAAEDWPQWRGAQRDGVWRESGIIERFEGDEIAVRWRAPVSNGYSGPTVAEGRVFLTDLVDEPEMKERLLAFDFEDGSPLWSYAWPVDYGGLSYPNGPRAAVTVDEGRAYALGAVGHLVCCDAASGEVLWERDLRADFQARVPVWGIAGAPLVEGDLLIVKAGGTPGACVVALDKATGEVRWTALEDELGYAPPSIIEQAGRRVLVCWTASRVVGLDPAGGELLWEHPFPARSWNNQIITPALHDDLLFVSTFVDGSLVLRLGQEAPTVEEYWRRSGPNERRTESLHILMGDPVIADGCIFGVDSYGQFRCIDLHTGERIWEDTTVTTQVRWGTAHMVVHGDRVWIFNDRGELIIARLTREGYEEISRAHLIAPTRGQLERGEGVTWSHPAFAHRHVLIRNDRELISASLAAER